MRCPTSARGSAATAGGWAIREVGDGNLNLVFLVNGPGRRGLREAVAALCRAAGESWPMPLERTYFEQAYYKLVGPHVKGLAPDIYHYDPALFALVMEQLSPHIIMRRGLIEGRRYPACGAACRRLHRARQLLHLRPRHSAGTEIRRRCRLRQQSGAAPHHRRAGVHRSVPGHGAQPLDQPGA